MSLTVPANGNTIYATDVSQLVNLLQVPSGGQETRHYWLSGSAYGNNTLIAASIQTLNHFSSPTGSSVNTSDSAPSGGMGTVNIGHANIDTCQIFSLNTTGPSPNATAGGTYTLNF